MKKNIAVLAGDGIGPEIMASAIAVLNAITYQFNHEFTYHEGLVGGAAYDKYQEHLPPITIDLCKKSDAILFGSVGGKIAESNLAKWRNCEINSILALRRAFNFNINLRKATLYKELVDLSPLKNNLLEHGFDIVIYRELIGDIYFGEHYLGEKHGIRYASDLAEYNEEQITDIIHHAFKLASKRQKKLVSVDKANVLSTSKLWRTVANEVAILYPEVNYQNMLVDNCAMQIIRNPQQFDVIVTSNLFGDILSDELSVLSGSIGMMPSASFNSARLALYEPAGGSAPEIAGLNIANPIGQILSLAMMLEYSFNLTSEAKAITSAIKSVITQGYRTHDLSLNSPDEIILGTREFTTKIIENINNPLIRDNHGQPTSLYS